MDSISSHDMCCDKRAGKGDREFWREGRHYYLNKKGLLDEMAFEHQGDKGPAAWLSRRLFQAEGPASAKIPKAGMCLVCLRYRKPVQLE